MPTETVYGLAADARNPKAIEAVFRAKGRPTSRPLIVHIGQECELGEVGDVLVVKLGEFLHLVEQLDHGCAPACSARLPHCSRAIWAR